MAKPIVVELTKANGDFPKGALLGFETESKASSTLGDGSFKVLRHQDGTLIDEPKSAAKQKSAPAPAAPAPQESVPEKKG